MKTCPAYQEAEAGKESRISIEIALQPIRFLGMPNRGIRGVKARSCSKPPFSTIEVGGFPNDVNCNDSCIYGGHRRGDG